MAQNSPGQFIWTSRLGHTYHRQPTPDLDDLPEPMPAAAPTMTTTRSTNHPQRTGKTAHACNPNDHNGPHRRHRRLRHPSHARSYDRPPF